MYLNPTLPEMKKVLGFSISALWYRIKQLDISLKKVILLKTLQKAKSKKEKALEEE